METVIKLLWWGFVLLLILIWYIITQSITLDHDKED